MKKWDWSECKNILCVRPDNIGDVLMTSPAIRAVKESFPNSKITLLTSKMGKPVVPYLTFIDDVIEFTVPWVLSDLSTDREKILNLVATLKERKFDAAIIFTVFSQNPLPTAFLLYMAEIPRVLAACRENPWKLINHWVPDTEPFSPLKHEVQRQLDLVSYVGATTDDSRMSLTLPTVVEEETDQLLTSLGVNLDEKFIVLHPGVTEAKRQYPIEKYAEVAKALSEEGYRIVLTGVESERPLVEQIKAYAGDSVVSGVGVFNLGQAMAVIKKASVIICNNTGPAHIAAAVGTPVVDLYALTNPQHTPWMVPSKVLYFEVPEEMKNPDPILQYIEPAMKDLYVKYPEPEDIVEAVRELLN